MENNQNSISTTLNISNTDIVTMLIAEKKEQLNQEVEALKLEKNEIITPYLNAVKAEMDKAMASKEYSDFRKQLYNFVKLYNPKIAIEIKTSNNFEYQFMTLIANCYSISNITFRLSKLTVDCAEEHEGEFELPFKSDEVEFPKKLDKKFPLGISKENLDRYNDIIAKIQCIDYRLRNTDKMKEEMVAAMTKQAIMNSPDLLAIRASVLQISE